MRRTVIALAACCAMGGLARAQTVPEGPLVAAPSGGGTVAGDRTLAGQEAATRKAAARKIAARKTVSKTHVGRAPAATVRRDTNAPAGPPAMPAAASGSPPDDPLSFGMKWSGSNDNGVQTRTQNYNGGAAGTGAEVGLKLHF